MADVLNFDRAGELNLVFRNSRAESRTLTFLSGEDPFPLAGYTFQLNIRKYNSSTPALQLTAGSGLTIADNVLTIALTEVQSNQPEVLHFWELYETVTKRSWIVGEAEFITRNPRSADDTEVNIVINNATVTISSLNSINGGTP